MEIEQENFLGFCISEYWLWQNFSKMVLAKYGCFCQKLAELNHWTHHQSLLLFSVQIHAAGKAYVENRLGIGFKRGWECFERVAENVFWKLRVSLAFLDIFRFIKRLKNWNWKIGKSLCMVFRTGATPTSFFFFKSPLYKGISRDLYIPIIFKRLSLCAKVKVSVYKC